jgi:hypothetical protein
VETKQFFNESGQLAAILSFIEPDIALVIARGKADKQVAVQLAGYIGHLFETEGLKGVVVDATLGEPITKEAVQIFAKTDAFKFIKKAGIYGVKNPVLKIGLEAIISASGRDNVRIFKNQEEAMDYVKDGHAN